uniref:Fibroblast growth factor n=1 Tax=Ciona intestinalis TaxID=7719 RepID=F7A4U1_CIOIN
MVIRRHFVLWILWLVVQMASTLAFTSHNQQRETELRTNRIQLQEPSFLYTADGSSRKFVQRLLLRRHISRIRRFLGLLSRAANQAQDVQTNESNRDRSARSLRSLDRQTLDGGINTDTIPNFNDTASASLPYSKSLPFVDFGTESPAAVSGENTSSPEKLRLQTTTASAAPSHIKDPGENFIKGNGSKLKATDNRYNYSKRIPSAISSSRQNNASRLPFAIGRLRRLLLRHNVTREQSALILNDIRAFYRSRSHGSNETRKDSRISNWLTSVKAASEQHIRHGSPRKRNSGFNPVPMSEVINSYILPNLEHTPTSRRKGRRFKKRKNKGRKRNRQNNRKLATANKIVPDFGTLPQESKGADKGGVVGGGNSGERLHNTLYIKRSSTTMRILPSGRVHGSRDIDVYCIVRFQTIGQKGNLIVKIRGEKSGLYLAMKRNGKLYATRDYNNPDTTFEHIYSPSEYDAYRSQTQRFFVAFNRAGESVRSRSLEKANTHLLRRDASEQLRQNLFSNESPSFSEVQPTPESSLSRVTEQGEISAVAATDSPATSSRKNGKTSPVQRPDSQQRKKPKCRKKPRKSRKCRRRGRKSGHRKQCKNQPCRKRSKGSKRRGKRAHGKGKGRKARASSETAHPTSSAPTERTHRRKRMSRLKQNEDLVGS